MKTFLGILITIMIAGFLVTGTIQAINYANKDEVSLNTNQTDNQIGSALSSGQIDNQLETIFAANHGKVVADVSVIINEESRNHYKGMVAFQPEGPGQTGMFLATDINGKLEIVFEGNGSPDCQEIAEYDFPETMLKGVCY